MTRRRFLERRLTLADPRHPAPSRDPETAGFAGSGLAGRENEVTGTLDGEVTGTSRPYLKMNGRKTCTGLVGISESTHSGPAGLPPCLHRPLLGPPDTVEASATEPVHGPGADGSSK
jgi:hypothetical protein